MNYFCLTHKFKFKKLGEKLGVNFLNYSKSDGIFGYKLKESDCLEAVISEMF
jgi:hypothetical protein